MSTLTTITAEEYARMSDIERPSELARGEILETDFPFANHGAICATIGHLGWANQEARRRMYVLINNVGVLTGRDPDTVRCPDVIFISRQRLSRESLNNDPFLMIPPDVVIDVASPWDSWGTMQSKVSEFLAIGVLAACIVDPETETVQVFRVDCSSARLTGDDTLTFPNVLPEFSVPVRKLFE